MVTAATRLILGRRAACSRSLPKPGTKYVFTTSSFGGKKCIGKLETDYSERAWRRARMDLPIVELRSEAYQHRSFGRVQNPVLHVVGWTDAPVNAEVEADFAPKKRGDMDDE